MRSWIRVAAAIVLAFAPVSLGAQPRPQEPGPDVPYRAEPVVVEVVEEGGSHTLAGTITLPDPAKWGDGPYPGAVLITGSGPQNRDSEMLGHKPFLVLADRLTRAGIAVLRYDDRGVGESTGDFGGGGIAGFVRDAAAAATALRAHPAVDPARVGLIGHSEGGTVGPKVAGEQPETAFVVLLAAMGISGTDTLIFQSETAYRQVGRDPAWLEANSRVRRAVFGALRDGADEEAMRPLVRAWVEQEMDYLADEAGRERAVATLMNQFVTPWFRQFVSVDPPADLRRVSAPVLALCGTLDMQVPADLNLPAIEKALAEGPCPSATIVRLPGLNHLFQPAKTGLMGEYGAIEITFDEATMGLVAGWIRGVVAGRGE